MNEVYPYSEIFYSIQGEGIFTGEPTVWLRYFGCNLQCNGFGQKDPTDPSSYKLPYQEFDVSAVSKLEELPVWEFGCDSSYSWSKKYRHLAHYGTPTEITERLLSEIPGGHQSFQLPYGNVHLCFTGGEPMIPRSQTCTREILKILWHRDMLPEVVTFETNGTKPLLEDTIKDYLHDTKFLFSVSPKLWTVAGEKNEKAIKPAVVRHYNYFGDVQLKFVVGPEDRQWEELLRVADEFRAHGLENIWVMPVGATTEEQQEVAGKVATRAIQHGFKVSARVHCYLWGNTIGV